jgi:hypothetical protein
LSDLEVVQRAEVEPLSIGAAVVPDRGGTAAKSRKRNRGAAEHPSGNSRLNHALAPGHDDDSLGIGADHLQHGDVPIVVAMPAVGDVLLADVASRRILLEVHLHLGSGIGGREPLHGIRIHIVRVFAANQQRMTGCRDGFSEFICRGPHAGLTSIVHPAQRT